MPASLRLPFRHFHRIAWLATLMTASTIVFGGFVRLSDAGLSCPDWPTCYGRATWPTAPSEVVDHVATRIRPLQPHKAWREQVHRLLAGTLGVAIFSLALMAVRRRRRGVAQVVVSAVLVAAAVPLYVQGLHVAASVVALLGQGILLAAAWRWSRASAPGGVDDLARVAALALAMIFFQALLGMWTVTWLLKPIVVIGHLLGGLTTFALLVWMAWRATQLPIQLGQAAVLKGWLWVGLALLVLQMALGGWVSSNYAALACGGGSWDGSDFPRCAGRWWPPQDFREGFTLWRGIGVDYEGGVLDGASRIAIQMTHRLMAVVVSCWLLACGIRLWRVPGMRGWAAGLLVALLAQVGLGILNVNLGLPLAVAVLHNAGAVLLTFLVVTLLARLKVPA